MLTKYPDNFSHQNINVCVCVCVCACVRACVRVCVRACVYIIYILN